MEDFGSRLKELRLSKGMSLRDLAVACNTSKSAIGYYENNQRRPKYETLEAFADIFNVDIDYLLGKSDIKNSAAHSLGFESLEEAYRAGALGSFPFVEDLLTEEEKEMIDIFRLIPEEDQRVFLEMGRAYANTLKKG
jgi:repressor LexA